MANTRPFGYNVALKIGGKTVVGTTSNSFDLNKKIKESITKDDAGKRKRVAIGYDFTFSVENLATIIDAANAATQLGRDEILALALTNDTVEFTYTMTGADGYSGSVLITSYSEKSGANEDEEVSISLNLQSNGDLTPIVA